MSDTVVIAGAARTPMAGFQGEFSTLTASDLGGVAIAAALKDAGVKAEEPEAVDEVLMGNVLPAGQGQAPARQAAFAAGLADSVPATTLNKMCGSGMKAVMLAHDELMAGNGTTHRRRRHGNCMTNAPYLLPQDARRRAAGPRRGQGPHVPRRPGGRL